MAPPWVRDALGPDAREQDVLEKEGVVVKSRSAGELALVRALLPDAARLDDRSFRAGVARCYVAALESVAGRGLRPVRMWNFVPDIRRPSDDGFSRYELFNAGRQQGYRECYGDDENPTRVTASAVGHSGPDFVVHLLAGRVEAVPMENPRQRPSYRYSRRYGPQPPCFSRAARVTGRLGALAWDEVGLAAGTASIVGEDSVHLGDLPGQLRETFRNLATIAGELSGRSLSGDAGPDDLEAALSLYRELRVYVAREEDARVIRNAVQDAFPAETRLDLVSARLCRPELLVEAEGVLCLSL